jgi:general secretion pathway protein G
MRNFKIKIANRLGHRASSGFTILEMMIVMAIILILIGVAAARYDKTIKIARESRLKNDLQVMRTAIDHYTLDKQTAPSSLQDLVDGHYLRAIPNDPITGQQDWVLHTGDTVLSPDQTGTGVDDVHSASEQTSSDGTPYNTW